MSEPSDEELERAERIRKLRSGGATSRSHEMRERRRESGEDETASAESEGAEAERDADESDPTTDDGDAAGDESDPADDEGADPADDDGDAKPEDESDDGPTPLSAGGQVDVLEMAAALPADGSLFVVPIREGLRRQFNTVAEQLHLRYGFQYGSELDAEQHVRPLALYLGVRALEDGDVEAVKKLLESVEELDGPESGSESSSGSE